MSTDAAQIYDAGWGANPGLFEMWRPPDFRWRPYPGPAWPSSSTPINDTVIWFSGWGGSSGQNENAEGQPLPDGNDMMTAIRTLPLPADHRLHLAGYFGYLHTSAAVTRAPYLDPMLQFIRDHFHPLGKLILFGYSAGGADVYHAARAIHESNLYYDYASGRLGESPVTLASRSGPVSPGPYARLRVDLMMTIDGAAGMFSNSINRTVPTCVRRSLNWYQRYDHIITPPPPIQPRSHGGASRTLHPDESVVYNYDWSHRYSSTTEAQNNGHASIGGDARPEALANMQHCLNTGLQTWLEWNALGLQRRAS